MVAPATCCSLLVVAAAALIVALGVSRSQGQRVQRFQKITGYVLTSRPLPRHYPTKRSGLLGIAGMDEKKITEGYHCSALFGYLDELPGIPRLFKRSNFKSAFTVYTPHTPIDGLRIGLDETKVLQLRDSDGENFDLDEFIEENDLDSPLIDVARSKEALRDRIVAEEEFPFDLHRLQRTKFNPTQTTRVVIAGFRSTEDCDWLNEMVALWRKLDPQSNIIKFSWDEGNHGAYNTAAYNSRLAGRHLSVFIYYLDQLFGINRDKFHLVGHSLGAQIASVVGADNGGRIARITGLDPAGPVFRHVPGQYRLDPSDAQFVDVFHTNAGLSIKGGAFGIEEPIGHVDYYANGGWVQPGCQIRSLGQIIPNPVCSHGRAHAFFRELIQLEIERRENGTLSEGKMWPKAYLVNRRKGGILQESVKQPDVLAVRFENRRSKLLPRLLPPLKLELDAVSLRTNYPTAKQGIYVFGTRSTAPFFGSNQYVLTMRTKKVFNRKIKLSVALRGVILFERHIHLSGLQSIIFVPDDPNVMRDLFTLQEGDRVTPLSFWWRVADLSLFPLPWLSFESIEVRALERDQDGSRLPVLKYDKAIEAARVLKKEKSAKVRKAKVAPDSDDLIDGEELDEQDAATEAPLLAPEASEGFDKNYPPIEGSFANPLVHVRESVWNYLNGRLVTA